MTIGWQPKPCEFEDITLQHFMSYLMKEILYNRTNNTLRSLKNQQP